MTLIEAEDLIAKETGIDVTTAPGYGTYDSSLEDYILRRAELLQMIIDL